jgi:hypothetical protein
MLFARNAAVVIDTVAINGAVVKDPAGNVIVTPAELFDPFEEPRRILYGRFASGIFGIKPIGIGGRRSEESVPDVSVEASVAVAAFTLTRVSRSVKLSFRSSANSRSPPTNVFGTAIRVLLAYLWGRLWRIVI